MADIRKFPSSRQFPGARPRQFGDHVSAPGPASQSGSALDCAQCESMLADVLDGTLTAAEQTLFEAHLALCEPCAQMLADARRGHAWLEMLRDPRPEPPAELLERILARTSAQTYGAATSPLAQPTLQPANAAFIPTPAPVHAGATHGRLLAFRTRFSFAHAILQPRLAMTAAMAFFSIALTMNLTGVRLQDVSADALHPSSLKRDFYSSKTRVVQYYEGLRVVYELESRVRDLQNSSGDDSAQPQPAPTPAAQPKQPSGNQQPQPSSHPGSSRIEPWPSAPRLLPVFTPDETGRPTSPHHSNPSTEGPLA